MLFISGAKFSFEVTKEESLLELNFIPTSETPYSSGKQGKERSSSAGKEKGKGKVGRPKKESV
jgi:hypothetical protein